MQYAAQLVPNYMNSRIMPGFMNFGSSSMNLSPRLNHIAQYSSFLQPKGNSIVYPSPYNYINSGYSYYPQANISSYNPSVNAN